jgi:hypothetical protein
VITRVVYEHDTHDRIQIIRVLIIYGNAAPVLEGLTDTSLKNILIEIRKKEDVQWSLTLLKRIEVEIVTHLIYPPKKIVCK